MRQRLLQPLRILIGLMMLGLCLPLVLLVLHDYREGAETL